MHLSPWGQAPSQCSYLCSKVLRSGVHYLLKLFVPQGKGGQLSIGASGAGGPRTHLINKAGFFLQRAFCGFQLVMQRAREARPMKLEAEGKRPDVAYLHG